MKNFVLRTVLSATLAISSASVWAQDTTQAPADNTKTNQRDRNSNEPTADQQKNNQPDRELAGQIRKSLINDKSLSTNGHNVKVIVQDGMVTLKGPVNSPEEKQAIEAKATEVAGAGKVSNELEVVQK